MENADAVVDGFNEQGFLPRPMRKFRIPRGETVAVGYLGGPFLAEIRWQARRDRVKAVSGDGSRRDLKIGINSLSLGGGINFLNNDEAVITLGTSADISFFQVSTRLGQDATINRTQFYSLGRNIGMGSTWFVNFFFKPTTGHKLGFAVRPWFHYRYFKPFDFYQTHRSITDPQLWWDYGVYADRGNSIGLTMELVFSPFAFE